jgi:signal transduction histidine kinase
MSVRLQRTVADRDRREDLRVFLVTTGALLLTFAIGSTVQAVFVFRPDRLTADQLLEQNPLLPARLTAGFVTVVFVLAACALIRLHEHRIVAVLGWSVGIAAAAAVGRHLLQLALGIYARPSAGTAVTEITSVAVVVAVSLLLGLLQARARTRLRENERAAAVQRARAANALAELAAEEVRVRREVAEGLHGTLQGRLVLAQTSLSALIGRGRQEGWDAADVDRLDGIRRDLEAVREHDVRELSQLVYPVGVDVGLDHAVRTMVRRIPAEIAVTADVAPAADHALGGTGPQAVGRRIAIVRAVEEGITNALRHGAATAIAITVALRRGEADGARIVLTVDDDGTGLPGARPWSGLARLAERLELHAATATLEGSPMGGARLRVELPVADG